MWAGCPHPAIGRSLRGEGTPPTVKPHPPCDEKRLQAFLLRCRPLTSPQRRWPTANRGRVRFGVRRLDALLTARLDASHPDPCS
mgnify:CR=1 FL=1